MTGFKIKTQNTENLKINNTENEKDSFSNSESWIHQNFHCILCGSSLEFINKTNFSDLTVEEESHCPECLMTHPTLHHKLQ